MTVKLPAWPVVNLAAGALVIAGAWPTLNVSSCVAVDEAPLEAVIVRR